MNWLNSNAGVCTGGSGTCTFDQFGGPTTVTISDSNCFAACTKRLNIYPVTPSSIPEIDHLSINGGSDLEPFEIVLGPDVFINPNTQPFGVDADWRGLDLLTTADTSIFYGGCSGDLLGSITGVDQIARFDCGGAIMGFVQADDGYLGITGAVFEVGSVASSGSFSIGRLRSLNIVGDCAGNITCTTLTTSIDIGGSQTDGQITGKNLNGTITAGGALRRVVITDSAGALTGNVEAQTLGVVDTDSFPPLNVTSLEASVFIDQDVLLPVSVGAWPGSDELFAVGRTLKERPTTPVDRGNRMIIIRDPDPEDSEVSELLTNQIIINAGNFTPTTDANGDTVIDENDIAEFWLGGVSINFPGNSYIGMDPDLPVEDEKLIGPDQARPYQSPYYTALSSELGGGAIGLAPFNFHQREADPPAGESRDCDPYHTEVVELGPSDALDSVKIQHYGRV